MDHRILFDYDDEKEIDEAVVAMQGQPRNFYVRISY